MNFKSLDRRSNKKESKLNLIPILDSVFIFIFFLLMSAQFIDIYEIGSDAPAISTTESVDKKDIPLNLTLDIEQDQILVKTGLEGKIYRAIANIDQSYNLNGLKEALKEIKQENPKEVSIVLKPKLEIAYEKIVKIIDASRKLSKTENPMMLKDKDGYAKPSRELFKKVIFETII